MVLAIVLVLLVVGSLLFHFLSPWYFTPIASNWGLIDDTVSITFWVTGIVFVAINLFMAYAVVRYRYRKGRRAEYAPENKKLEAWLVGVTTVGVVLMLAPGLFVWAKFVEVPKDAAVFEAMGKQWHWGFRFPGEDGVMGTVDARLRQRQEPVRHESGRSQRTRRRLGLEPGSASPHRQAGQGAAALDRRSARLRSAAVPGQDGSGAGPGHLHLVHAHPDREIRPPLRGVMWRCTFHHAWQSRGGRRGRVSGVVRAAIRRSRNPRLESPAMLQQASRSMQCVPPVMACKRRAILR